jgi:hypothetical protein
MNRFNGFRKALQLNGWLGSNAVPSFECTKARVWLGWVVVSRLASCQDSCPNQSLERDAGQERAAFEFCGKVRFGAFVERCWPAPLSLVVMQ